MQRLNHPSTNQPWENHTQQRMIPQRDSEKERDFGPARITRSAFAPKNGGISHPCSNYSVFKQKQTHSEKCLHFASKTHLIFCC